MNNTASYIIENGRFNFVTFKTGLVCPWKLTVDGVVRRRRNINRRHKCRLLVERGKIISDNEKNVL